MLLGVVATACVENKPLELLPATTDVGRGVEAEVLYLPARDVREWRFDGRRESAGDSDAGVPDVVTDVRVDVEPDQVEADSGPDEVTPDVPADETEQPAGLVSDEFLVAVCETYCDHVAGCSGTPFSDDCETVCPEAASADEDLLFKMVCVHSVGEGEGLDYCDVWDLCTGDWEVRPDCVEVCVKLDKCGALGNPNMGFAPGDCELGCTASVEFGEGTDEVLQCYDAALADCSRAEFYGCTEELPDVCGETCSEEFSQPCGLVPEIYETADACAAVCTGWHAGQVLAAMTCLDTTADWPLECVETAGSCLQVPAALPDGAIEYCQQMGQKCSLYSDADMGLLTDHLCAWQMTGIMWGVPALFRDFDSPDTLACIQVLDVCPSDIGVLACLVAPPGGLIENGGICLTLSV